MTAEAQRAASGQPADSIAAAWRDLQSPAPPDEQQRMQADVDRQRRERAIEEQLAYLKKKMGRGRVTVGRVEVKR